MRWRGGLRGPGAGHIGGPGAPIAPDRISDGAAGAVSVQRRLPALERRRRPLRPDGPRALDPRPELGLGELRVALLELDPVRVPGLQVLDQHLARDLVLAPRRDR